MSNELDGLVREVAALTAATLPEVARDDAPVLNDRAIAEARGDDAGYYFVGLIGGKDVGKSALVNALVGQPITTSTSFGPGTETVIAYAHRAFADDVTRLLEREVPGRYRVVTHELADLRGQVLLDLPDIDSHYADHVEITRRMLRHMLFPVWIQSIEKYADQQPQQLLATVAAGNDPANFVFCLNKVDQLHRDGVNADAAKELGDDFARRIARTLKLQGSPRVYLISATHPSEYDLPAMRQLLSRQKSTQLVKRSGELAARQRNRSVLEWLDAQRLPAHAQRLHRLQEEAEELTAARLAVPLLEQAIPRMMDDKIHRAAITDEVVAVRVGRWPIVNALHAGLLSPLTSVWRAASATAPPAETLVNAYVDPSDRPLATAVKTTFAHLHQSHPGVGPLFGTRKLWEDLPANEAAAELRQALVSAVEGQRTAALNRLAGRGGVIAPLFRILLTVGAVLWFPFVQPVLEAILQDGYTRSAREIALLAVQLLGATYLLKTVGFLAIWFVVLWLYIRWHTHRRVGRLLKRWQSNESTSDASLSPIGTTVEWIDNLLDPIRAARQRADALVDRTESLRTSLATAA